MAVIGISCFYHDSAAALISSEGEIIVACQEERFTRKKHDSSFPFLSINYCLKQAQSRNLDIEAYVYYEKPIRVFMRLLETYFNTSPRGFSSFLPAMRTWISDKLFTKYNIIKQIKGIDKKIEDDSLFFSEHHLSHAAAAFYPSPFKKAVVLCMDAVGEWVTTSAWLAEDNKIEPIWEIDFPHSIGLLYSAFTYYCGFKVNSGEYKLMGLAPYGKPIYAEIIKKELIDIKEDGSFKLNMRYFKFHRGLKMISSKFIDLFGIQPRKPIDNITEFHMDIAASIQAVTEEIIIKIVNQLSLNRNVKNLCLSGGVALNCVANGKLLENSKFENIWVQPASGDSGSAVGSALAYLYLHKNKKRLIKENDSMNSSYLGPEFTKSQIKDYLDFLDIKYEELTDENLYKETAERLSKGLVIGWFQGKMEYGPRSLGNRSILGDPRIKDMQKTMNLKIKNRESFRPFAPAILDEFKSEYFNLSKESPYMLFTRYLDKKFLNNNNNNSDNLYKGLEKVNQIRSTLPAITHIDNSCRVQTVSKKRNKKFHRLLTSFFEITGCPVLINTSFNVRGEPIVCTPEDAFKCFLFTEIDILVLGNYLIEKKSIDPKLKDKFIKPFLIED